jgi:YVTN family beta-propeller protein
MHASWVPAVLAALGAATAARADLLIVLNKSDHEAALVDPDSYAILVKLPTGQGPHEVAVSPDGHWAFVTNYGAYGIFRAGQQVNEPGRSITAIDLAKRKVHATHDLGEHRKPHGIAVSRDGRLVWVTCEGTQTVLELDAGNGRIRHAWKTDQNIGHMLVPSRDEKKLFVANIGSGSITVIERASGRIASFATGAGAEGLDVSPDGREVWVANRSANTVSVVDVAADSVTAQLESGGEFPIRVKFTPDGRQAWVSNAKSNEVAIFDAKTRKRLGAVAVGAVPVGIQMSPDGKRAFVANTNDDRVTVIDVAKRAVIRTLETGDEPDGMAWARGR